MPLKTRNPSIIDFEDEATLFSLSSEFLEAARILIDTPPRQTSYTTVAYFLTAHAAELMIKSILFKSGDTIENLRKRYGHDLKLLVRLARSRGLLKNICTVHIQDISGAYSKKRTEYRKKTPLHYPPLDLLFKEVVSLQAYAFDKISVTTNTE